MYLSLDLKDFDSLDIDIEQYKIDAFKAKNNSHFEGLERYLLNEENILNATEIQKHLFPEVEADIFLSHAHADEDKVIALAVCLESIGFNVFVDSCIWENAFTLLKAIDDKHCKFKDNNRYSYDKRNYSTANIYMILNSALHHMIQKSELFIFLGTEQSLTIEKSIESFEDKEFLKSPWIFSELTFVNQVVRYDSRAYLRPTKVTKSISIEDAKVVALDESLKFHFNKPILDFSLSNEHFIYWYKNWRKLIKKEFSACEDHIQSLEVLYDVMKEKGKKREDSIFQQYIDL